MKLLIFLPCLNEAATITEVIRSLPKQVEGVDRIDVLVVDDGSQDDSGALAKEAGAIVLRNTTNMGVGYSFQKAIRYANKNSYELMCNIDADGQFNPNDIPRLLAPIIAGKADFVSGSRFLVRQKIEHMSSVKYWGNHMMNKFISSLSGKQYTDVSCGFRAYSREALLRMNLQGRFTYTQEVFLNLDFQGLRITEVPIEVRYFKDRKSRVASNIFAYAVKTSKIIFRTYRDYRPLRFFTAIAAAFFMMGAAFLLFLMCWWLMYRQFSPHIWSGFVGAGLCFSGFIFFVLGLLADMNTRIRGQQEEILYLLKKNESKN